MPNPTRAVELVAIGDELLLGFTLDTNGAYLSHALADIGITVVRRTSVGDEPDAIATVVRESLARTGAVITTGGLGPTADDLTRAAIAEVFGRQMHHDERIQAALEHRWRLRGLPGTLPEANRQQAMVPEGARILENRHGTAPGLWLEDAEGRWAVMLPGVPREMRGMVADTLIPALRERSGSASIIVRSRTLRTTGIAESALAELVGARDREVLGLPLAFLPGVDGVDLRITARGLPAERADSLLAAGLAHLRQRAGAHAYGEGSVDLAEIVLETCRERGLHIGLAESCTGGLLGARLTSVPGASEVVAGGVIAYDDRLKTALLAVSETTLRVHGAVSEPAVMEMAAGARDRLETEIGLAITGIAGPGGGTPEKPVGTVWFGLAFEGTLRASRLVLGGDREEIRQRATQAALDIVRRTVGKL